MLRLFIMLSALLMAQCSMADSLDHQTWDRLLKENVLVLSGGRATVVDYQGMARDRASLRSYLSNLSAVSRDEFERWGKQNQLAFLINAYNAVTVELILDTYPNLESIKDLGSFFRSPWSKPIVTLLGQKFSLDDIEHDIIRGWDRYNEPRIHFAVNCASIGCPSLRAEAYIGRDLEKQLEEQTHLFLSDRSRNRLNGDLLEVSSLFKWYREDFERGWQGLDSLTDFFVQHANSLGLTEEDLQLLLSKQIEIDFLDYDWRLNDHK